MSRWLLKLVEAAIITVTIAAVCQELEKPAEERRWHGRLGVIPYDFRLPGPARLKQAFWNEEENRVFHPSPAFGIGWGVNFHALFEKMRIVGDFYLTEDDFLMPTESLRKILEKRPPITEEAYT